MLRYEYCPKCGAAWTAWGDTPWPDKCWACGHVQEEVFGAVPIIEPMPEKCEDHPKYKGIGSPNSDCLTCWKMHKVIVDAKIKELSHS